MTKTTDIEELLVSYVNGSATPDERRRAEDAIQGDPAMAAEHNFLSALRAAAKVPHGETPGAFGLDRLRRTLDRYRREQRRLRFWRTLTAFAASLLVAVSALYLNTRDAERDDVFQVLQGAGKGTLQVRFQPGATSVELQDLFRDLGLEIVSGPSAVGVYRLRLRQDNTPAAREKALLQLRERPTLVEFVEHDP